MDRSRYLQSGSHVRVRIYQWDATEPLNDQWLLAKITLACSLREQWQRHHGQLDAVRLVNSEGDGLSGLVIERFGPFAVIQVNAAGMQAWLPLIASGSLDRYQLTGVLQRVDEKIAAIEGMQAERTLLAGSSPTQPIMISEHDVKIQFDLEAGQKTGYYLDQRANRYAAAHYMHGSMLDVCTYVGGFALAACRHGEVSSVRAIDMSNRALTEAAANATLNNVAQSIRVRTSGLLRRTTATSR